MANREVDSQITRAAPFEVGTPHPHEDEFWEAAASMRSPTNTVIEDCMLTDAAQSVIQTGYGHTIVKQAIMRIMMTEGIENLTGEKIMGVIFSIEEEEGMNSPIANRDEGISANEIDVQKMQGGANPSAVQESSEEKLMREYQELLNATLCKVCLDQKICVVFLPCGHMVTCISCASKVKECPICRNFVKATVKAYFK